VNTKQGRLLSWCLLYILLGCGAAAAQTNTGQISGTVRDASGGILPGVTVTVRNENTGIARTDVTSATGTFVVTNLPVGTYSVSAELQGFRKAEKTGFQLSPDSRITADFTLGVGSLTETVDVVAVRGETVNKTSGEIARTIDGDQVRELALSGRNYLELASLITGAVQLDDDQMALTTSLSTTGTVINGSRGNTNSLTIDGGFNLDSGSNASQINNVGLDFIDQVRIQTSNFSAEYGRNSGASINVVTKSGTNRVKGSTFGTFRNDRFDAANAFAAIDPTTGKRIKAPLDFKDVGFGVGGPLKTNRLFYFGGTEYKHIDRVDGPFRRTMPTRAELGGDFSRRSATINDPLTGQPFPGNIIPSDRITADGRAIANVYRAMIDRALLFNDSPTSNNATYQLDFPFKSREDILRIDYAINSPHRLYLRFLHDMYDLVEPRGTFIGADLPTISTNRRRPGYGYQVGHSWIIAPNLVNEAKANASWNSQRIPPAGDAWQRDTYGFRFPQVFDKGRYDEGIPDVTITNFASLTGPSQSLLSPTTDITMTDTLTWLKDKHSLKVGLIVTRNRKDQNGRLAHTGAVSFNASGNTNTTGFAVADMLLGNFRSYSEGGDDPIGFFRFTQYGGFVADTWRVRPNLSIDAGIRYELASPTYTQQNNIVNFDPALYDPRAAATLNPNGTIANVGTNRYTGLIRAGSGVPDDQKNRVTIDPVAGPLIPTGAPRGLYATHHLWMPRLSGAYSINERTVLRAGGGVYFDKPEGNVIFSQVNLPPFVPSVNVENGNLGNPLAGRAAAESVLGTVNAIDPNMKIPRQINFSVSLQRELAWGHFAEAAYVGNRGHNQLWMPEINQASFDALVANAALPSAQRANTNYLRPYKGYSSIRQRRSDAFSKYDSLQLYLNKRRGFVKYTVNYTLMKATGNASGNGDNPEEAFDRAFNTGPLSFDRRHALVTTFTYQVPFMRDRRSLLAQVIGGWEVSGRTRYQSGQYLTVTGNTSIGTRRADYVGGDIDLPSGQRSSARWFNTTAFAPAPDTRRGNGKVGMVEGPPFNRFDLSLRKNFRLAGSSRVEVRADAFNVLNHVNLNNPNVTVTNNAFGTISGAKTPREFQFGLRFAF
jgi:hypothetical protein